MRTLSLLGVIALTLLCVPAFAGEFPVPIEEAVLGNGLEVYCVRRPGAPQAACLLGVRTGSSAERDGYTGIAHFLEHMLFKGTDRIGVVDPVKDRELRGRIDGVMAEILRLEDAGAGEEALKPLREERDRLFAEQQANLVLNQIFSIYSEAGGARTNAFTNDDMTAFFSVLPPHRIELFFWVESERFRRPVFRQFHSEKNVVREERRLAENRPGYVFREELGKVLFGSHPYAHPVLGYHEDLRRLTRGDMRAFFETFYTPDNMFLVVAGDVEPAEVFDLAKRYFGDWAPYAGERPRIPPVPASRSGPVRVTGTGPGSPSLTVAFRLPPAGGETDVEATMIADLLGDEEGDLARLLVRERGVATGVGADHEAKLHGSVLWISVDMREGHRPGEAEADVLAAVRRLVEEPPPEERMASLRRRYRARILGAVRSDMRLGFVLLRHVLAGSWRDIDRNLARARALPAEALTKYAATHLSAGNWVIGSYETGPRPPEPPAPPRPRPARTAEPLAAGAPADLPASWKDLEFPRKPLELPSGAEHVLALGNGVRVVAVPDPDEPVFRIEALFSGGSAEDPVGREGAAELLAAALSLSGTPDLPRDAVRERLEEIVGEYRVEADRFSLRFSLETFPQDLRPGLDLFRRLVLRSAPDAGVAAAEREAMRSRVAGREVQPGALANRSFADLLWAGDVRVRRPTPDSVASISPVDLEAILDRHRDPGRLVLAVSGPFDREEVAALLEEAFGSLAPGAGPVPVIPSRLPQEPAAGLHVMDFDSSQGYVLIGARTVAANDPRYPAVLALEGVLSRRIFNRIRSNEGLAYQAAARLTEDREVPSLFAVVFQTKNPSVPFGISLALDEIAKIAAEGPTEDELENVRQRNRAGLERSMGRAAGRAAAFAGLLLHPGTALDWHRKLREAILALTPEDVAAAARDLLRREDLLVVCVGDREQMEPGDGEHPETLAGLGPVRELAPPEKFELPSGPTAAVLDLVRALGRGDLDAALLLAAGPLRETLAAPGARERIAREGRVLAGARCRIGEVAANEHGAAVSVDLEIPRDGGTVAMTLLFELTCEDDVWRCTDFRPSGSR